MGKDPNGPLELYNLANDPLEKSDVADAHSDLPEQFSRMMEEERIPSDNFNFGMKTYSGE